MHDIQTIKRLNAEQDVLKLKASGEIPEDPKQPGKVNIIEAEIYHENLGNETVIIINNGNPEKFVEQINRELYVDLDEVEVDDRPVVINWGKPSKIELEDITTVHCAHCGNEILKEKAIRPELYNTPWDEYAPEDYYCSQVCVEATIGTLYSKDFAYQVCESCGRTICQQHPGNGWRWQFKGEVCCKCYQDWTLKEGQDREEIDKILNESQCPGEFYNESDLHDHDWERDEAYKLPDHMEPFRQRILALVNQNKKILINFDRMAYGGMEGYISIYLKKDPDSTNMDFEQFKKFNAEKGRHWFEPDTIRFFGSKFYPDDQFKNDGYFISSEQNDAENPRYYTIRQGDFENGKVDTIGEFLEYKTLSKARSALKEIRARIYLDEKYEGPRGTCRNCGYEGTGFRRYNEPKTRSNPDPVNEIFECPKCKYGNID
jgi:hypothetical protein